jgi:predicted nucleic acid-binding protein
MYLLDTCIFSELTKKDPSQKVIEWILGRDESLYYVSALTLGEIIKGIEKTPDPSRKKKLEQWVQEFLYPRFSHRLLTIDKQIALTWGQLTAKAEKTGRSIPTIDGLIAATALFYHLTVVTRNTKDFEDHVSIYNPWD